MKSNQLCAAVLSGIMLGIGGSFLPVGALPVMAPTVAEAAQAMTVTVGQSGTYKTLTAALKDKKVQKAESVTIKLQPGTYREKVTFDQPNITLVGEDAAKTTIVWNDAEGTPLRPGDKNGSKTTYTMECATVKVTDKAKGFQAVNVTFANDFPTEEKRADGSMKSVQAFAVTDEADQSSFYNCRFLGRQDTLYANAGTQYYKDCYIEGDVDFIFGQATAVFDTCEIHALNRALKQDGKSHGAGYLTAPSTLAQDKGYLFYKCHITSSIPDFHYGMLGRPWHPSSEQREVNSAATFRECVLDIKIKAKGWNSMKNKFGVYQPEDNRLYEYKNSGKGAVTAAMQAKENFNRKQLTDEEAVNYTPEAFLGSWKPAKRA